MERKSTAPAPVPIRDFKGSYMPRLSLLLAFICIFLARQQLITIWRRAGETHARGESHGFAGATAGHNFWSSWLYHCQKMSSDHVMQCAFLERATGLEPAIFCLGSRHSTTELRPRDQLFKGITTFI